MNNDNSTIELIKEKADIVTIAERYIQLKKAGKNFVGLCPFHSEKTPSFNISPDIQIFKCFGCGKSGDVITFIQEIEKLDFKEAIEKLAKETGVELKNTSENEPYKIFYDMNYLASEIYIRLLKNSKGAMEYVRSRGITDEDIEKFRIGFAPANNIVLSKCKEKFKLTKAQYLQSGLFIEKDGVLRDKFRDRIIFPMMSANGKIIGFIGRILPGNNYGPKYLHSPETVLFHKSSSVYGLFQAKQSIRKEDLCIICEGSTDVISAHRIGISNIVAPLGTSLVLDQLQKVSHFTKNILFIFDSDLAGQKALERAFLLAEKLGLNSYAVNTSPAKDIDELIQKDEKELAKRIAKKGEAFTYLISAFIEKLNLSSLQDQVKLTNYVRHLTENLNSSQRRAFYINKVNAIVPALNMPIENLEQRNEVNENKVRHIDLSFEELYLKLLLEREVLSIPENHDIGIFKNKNIIDILSTIKDNQPIITKLLHKKLENRLREYLEDIALVESFVTPEELEDIYSRIKELELQVRVVNLQAQLAVAEGLKDNKRVETLFNELNELMAKLKRK
ncbi:DNA primase [Candidatus Dojkabacteria bacterium]|nr:DNA primase [Candidatus Dojkabacteria bacterium]